MKYRKPAWYDDMLEIRCMVLELKNASVTIGYEILNRDTQELLVTGWTKHALVDGRMKPVALRKKVPELERAMKRFVEGGRELFIPAIRIRTAGSDEKRRSGRYCRTSFLRKSKK